MIHRKRLLEKINTLGQTEHLEILKIVNANGVQTTENKNGVFFNMTSLSPDAFRVVEEFVNYCYDNKLELDKYDQKMHACKYYNKTTFATAYGVNEPKNKRNEATSSSNMSDAAVHRAERMDNSIKMNDFVRKLCANNECENKRTTGSFTTWKKKFMKRSVDADVMLDLLEHDDRRTV
jgi:hypothetical protein